MTLSKKNAQNSAAGTSKVADSDAKVSSISAKDTKGNGFDILEDQYRQLSKFADEVEYIDDVDQANIMQKDLVYLWGRTEILHQVLFEEACHAGLQNYTPLADAEIISDLVSFLVNAEAPYEKYVDIARLRVAGRLIKKLTEEEPENGLIVKLKASGVDSELVAELFLDHVNNPRVELWKTGLKLRHLKMRRTGEHAEEIPLSHNISNPSDGRVSESIKKYQRCKGRGGWWDDTDPGLLPLEKRRI